MCTGPTIELGCGPGRLVARLIQRASPHSVSTDPRPRSSWRAGAVRRPCWVTCSRSCPERACGRRCYWSTATSGFGGDPLRILARAFELLARGGRCIAEFEAETIGIRSRWVRLESSCEVGPWFRWATVGVDSAAALAAQVGLTLTGVRLIGDRVIASLAAV